MKSKFTEQSTQTAEIFQKKAEQKEAFLRHQLGIGQKRELIAHAPSAGDSAGRSDDYVDVMTTP